MYLNNLRIVRAAAAGLLLAGIGFVNGAAAQVGMRACQGVEVQLNRITRTGPGDITADLMLRNTNNDDMAMFVYYGGANGKNTFLIDDSGGEWPKKRIDGNGNHRQAIMAGVPTRYSLIFHKAAGGQDARSFQVILWVQLLPLTGIGEVGWCKFQFPNVPLVENGRSE